LGSFICTVLHKVETCEIINLGICYLNQFLYHSRLFAIALFYITYCYPYHIEIHGVYASLQLLQATQENINCGTVSTSRDTMARGNILMYKALLKLTLHQSSGKTNWLLILPTYLPTHLTHSLTPWSTVHLEKLQQTHSS